MVRLGLRALLSTAALVALALLLAGASRVPNPEPALPGADAQPALTVVVNAEVPARTLDRATVRRIFLMRERFWKGRLRTAPVNLPADSPLRDRFSREVLGRAPRELAEYWNDLWFHGTAPPPVLQSEQAVLLYVARTPGAIGYVASATLADGVPAGVRVGVEIR